jgi:membrane associated rhomboid family serine protease
MAYRSSFSFGYSLTPWVQRLIIANVVVFVVRWLIMPGLNQEMAFVPGLFLVRPWTLITYMFAHGNFWHLFFNMLGLFFFGPPLEARWGSREFVKFYFICGLGGALLSFLFAFNSPIIGASAAVYGIMLAFAMNWPDVPIYIYGILPVQAKWLVGIIAVFSFMSALNGRSDGVAHFAHLGGFAAGFLYLKWDRAFRSPLKGLRKLTSKRRMSVVPGGQEQPKPARPEVGARPSGERSEAQLLDDLDRVLDKISTEGMSSLTPAERRLLDDASRRHRKN